MVRTSSSLRRLLDIVDYLVDDRVGVIRHVGEIPREAGAPDFFHFHAQACDTSAFCHQKNFSNTGGASTNRGRAMAKAIGEAIERYCAAIFDKADFPLTSFTSAQFHCIPPHEFALYSSSQYSRSGFPYLLFEETTPVRWTPMIDPLKEEPLFVPASMVYIPYSYDTTAGEHPIAQPISTGLA